MPKPSTSTVEAGQTLKLAGLAVLILLAMTASFDAAWEVQDWRTCRCYSSSRWVSIEEWL